MLGCYVLPLILYAYSSILRLYVQLFFNFIIFINKLHKVQLSQLGYDLGLCIGTFAPVYGMVILFYGLESTLTSRLLTF